MTSKAQKYCKFAVSALDYDDSSTAILNLTKALKLLQTGEDNWNKNTENTRLLPSDWKLNRILSYCTVKDYVPEKIANLYI